MEENKVQSISFFKKVWYSITKFEKYPDMAAEGTKNAIKYLAIMMIFVTIFVTIGSLKEMYQVVQNLASYIESNIPEFSYSDGKMTMETEEPIIITDVQYSTIDKVVIDTSAETDEQKNAVEDQYETVGTTIYFYKDQIILKSKNENNDINRQPYIYKDFIANYTQKDIKSFNKAELIEYMTTSKMNSYYMRYTVSILVYLIIMNILLALLDALELGVLGYITTIVARIKMRFAAIYNMAIYSLTLPMILNIVYIIINYFVDFKISYFQVAYVTIAYIYLAASIFILKDDFMKKQEELDKIKQEQLKVREEIRQEEEKRKEEKKEKTDKKREKDNENDEGENNNKEEPKGSEA